MQRGLMGTRSKAGAIRLGLDLEEKEERGKHAL